MKNEFPSLTRCARTNHQISAERHVLGKCHVRLSLVMKLCCAHAFLLFAILVLLAPFAQGALVSLSSSGTISFNSSADPTIPVGTPWMFEIIYDTNAPDLDFELTGSPDPTFGRYTNTGAVPALTFFHYRAGTYELTLDEPSDFGPFSEILITFGGTHAIDINLNANSLFPPLAGGPVSFHADFNDFTHSALTSDALPTDTSLSLQDFQGDASVTLLPPRGVVLGALQDMTSFTSRPFQSRRRGW
jgi:hypothetical protein